MRLLVASKIDFNKLNAHLLPRAESYLFQWLPQGQIHGREFCVGSTMGERGTSLKINMQSGVWKDFATGEGGADLISLFAELNGCKQSVAARTLMDDENLSATEVLPDPKPRIQHNIIKPPAGVALPNFTHIRHGKPSAKYGYRDKFGELLFVIARYDHGDGKKDLIPFTYSDQGKWVKKMWPGLRPLYGLGPELNRARAILVVEGEKSVQAARKIIGGQGPYHVVSWAGGTKAVNKTDWTPLFNKTVLIWPDADTPGKEAAAEIAGRLVGKAKQVKVIDTGEVNGGWDSADALSEGMGWPEFLEWAKPRARLSGEQPEVDAPSLDRPEPPMPLEVIHEAEPEIMPEGELPPMPTVHQHVHMTDEHIPQQVSPEMNRLWLHAGLAVSGTGLPVISVDNCLRLLNYTELFKRKLWFDEFHVDIFTEWDGPRRPWSEQDMLKLLVKFQRDYGFHRLKPDTLELTIRAYAYAHRRNEAMDWMKSLKWDGVSRIQQFFKSHLSADESEYTQAASKNWWVSMVARIMSPGSQVDNMVILEGVQGARKTSLLREIAGEWYAEASAAFGTKDFYQQIQGKLIIEIAELDMFSKSDVNTIKRVVSNTVDEFRAPYERKHAKHPRRCVFVGTTNQDGYLMDETGNRRYWPITVGLVDMDKVKADREQLFAEAMDAFKQGDSWWEMPEMETKRAQAERLADDPWSDAIEKYINDIQVRITGTTCTEVATKCLDIEIGRLSRKETVRIGKCLRQLGWHPRVIREGNVIKKRFMQPDHERLSPEQQDELEVMKQTQRNIPNMAPQA